MRVPVPVLTAATLAAIALAAACARPAPLPEDPAARWVALLDRAWGPESPATLQTYLGVRRALKPLVERHAEGIEQWSLREVSTRPLLGQAVLGVAMVRKSLDEELKTARLDLDDYTRLTLLVYGRWLRAVRPDPLPEARVLRTLQEVQIGLERQLAANPPEQPSEKRRLEERLAAVAFQARYLAPLATADKTKTLTSIDKETAAWLEAHRKDIEDLDFGLFDTAVPPRPRPKVERPAAAPDAEEPPPPPLPGEKNPAP